MFALAQPRINGVGTAVPDYRVEQEEAKRFFMEIFREGNLDLERIGSVFDNARIDTRYFCTPLEWLAEDRSFEEKNSLYIEHATTLGAQAAKRAIEEAAITPREIHSIVVVSSGGVAVPSLDARIIERLGLSRHVTRKALFGLGCAGGVNGISHAADYARGNPGQHVLFVAVEPNMLTFQRNDLSETNFVSCSIFGDGAAAVVLNTWGKGPKFIGRHNTLLPCTDDILGWDIINTGFKIRLSSDLPAVVLAHLPQLFEDACDRWGISRQQISNFLLHPGGARVLDGCVETLDLKEEHLVHSAGVLRDYGNMSSPTALFVLDRYMKKQAKQNGEYSLMIGFGPGFSTDQALLQW